MHWTDGHLDLAYLALRGRDLLQPVTDSGAGCVSLPALREGGVNLACATIFTEPCAAEPAADAPEMYRADDVEAAEQAGVRQWRVYEELESRGAIRIVREARDLDSGGAGDGPLRVVLLMEGGDPIRSPADVPAWVARGVRIVGLAWAAGTRYAGGNGPPPGTDKRWGVSTSGLSSIGIEMVRALDDAGVIHDASHLSDQAFDDLMEHASGPVIASHSNCRALMDDGWQRHLRDEQIVSIGARGGIVGLNLFTKFLATGRRATTADCVAHVEHVVEVMGHRRGIALGSDMDGGFGPSDLPADLDHPTKLHRLGEALRDRGWSDTDAAGFAEGNWRRFLLDHLPTAKTTEARRHGGRTKKARNEGLH